MKRFLLLVLTAFIFWASYSMQKKMLLNEFRDSALSVESRISQNVRLSNDYIDYLGDYGNQFFTQSSYDVPDLFQRIQYDPTRDVFHLDSIEGLIEQQWSGNLTGAGKVPTSPEAIRNVSLSLYYNIYFSDFQKKNPNITWIYYTGQEGFINIYPWVSSKTSHFQKTNMSNDFYKNGLPENNPSRSRYWTSIYLDDYGKGLMVTVSKPIYATDNFRGVVSMDYTLSTLTALLRSKYETLIYNDQNQIVASTYDQYRVQKNIQTIRTFFGNRRDTYGKDLMALPPETLTRLDESYVYVCPIDGVPWKMVHSVPVASINLQAFYLSFPMLLIGMLLWVTVFAYEKSKMAETKLKQTISELETSRKLLETLASIDPLTKILNRRSISRRMGEEVQRVSRYGGTFSIIMGDIDHFKMVNDLYGHACGDAVLVAVVEMLQANCRVSDMISRWGGEEFLLVLPETNLQAAQEVAEKLRGVIESHQTVCFNRQIHVTMSFGVSEFSERWGLDKTIIHADDALYTSKKNGRNQITCHPNTQA